MTSTACESRPVVVDMFCGSGMTDHCHIELRIELYDRCEMSENGEGTRILDRIKESTDKILANEGFFPHEYFISTSVLP